MVAAGAVGRVRDRFSATAGAVRRWRDTARRRMDTVPAIVRTLSELARVEAVDRATSIGAQALLALLPMLVVLAAFLPDLAGEGTAQFAEVAGVGASGGAAVQDTVDAAPTPADVDVAQVRAATGALGILVIVFSASSFARSLQRFYARLWSAPRIGGVVARRRCLSWLVGWLAALQLLGLVGSWVEETGVALLEPVWWVVRWGLLVLIWWWTTWALLLRRVEPRRLFLPAVACASGMVAFTWGSALVMPQYVVTSAEQFGSLGVVLAVATWLVGIGFVVVLTTTLGKVLDEDPWVDAVRTRLTPPARRRQVAADTRDEPPAP